MENNLKLGLALGSGGARGLAHIGVLEVLERKGVKIDMISGTSIGAVIGYAYASGMKPAEIEKIALSIKKKETFKLFRPSISLSGLTDGKNIEDLLSKYIGCKSFKDLNIQFACVATEFYEGTPVVFNKGDVLQSVRASLSIPVLIKPKKIEDNVYIDGGLSDPIPVNILREMGADIIIAVNVINNPQKNKHIQSYIDEDVVRKKSTEKTKENVLRDMIVNKIERVAKGIPEMIENKIMSDIPPINVVATKIFEIAESKIVEQRLIIDKPDILIEPYTYYASIMDFEMAPKIIYQGKRATLEKIDEIKKLIRGN